MEQSTIVLKKHHQHNLQLSPTFNRQPMNDKITDKLKHLLEQKHLLKEDAIMDTSGVARTLMRL